MILTRTPYRVSLFGGGSDYPSWYREHGGATLGFTIDKYCWLMVKRPPFFGSRFKIVYSRTENAEALSFVRHRAVHETVKFMGVGGEGLELYHTSDLPARSGVGSSSAFVVGLVRALAALRNQQPAKGEVAAAATHIEQHLLQETVGSQDQYLCAFGGLNVVEFHRAPPSGHGDALPPHVRPVLWSLADLNVVSSVLEARLMLFYTGLQRTSSDVASGYVPDLPKRGAALNELVAMARRGEELLKAVADGADPDPLGVMLDKAWRLKRSLGTGVSNQTLDDAYEAAKGAGALGGKVLGAGGGGHLLLYVPEGRRQAVRQALPGMAEVPWSMDLDGTRVEYPARAA